MISDKEIVENMTAKEKFNVMCRIKQIDEQEMAQSIYDIIESSDLADKDIYQGYVCIEPEDEWNEQYNRRCLNITYSLLETFDDYDLHKFAEKLHEDIKITHEIDINGSLWVNSAKYEYVDKIVVGYDDIDIYWKGKMIGSIARENLQTMLEQNYEENTTIDLIEELAHSFNMKKVGDL